MRNLMLTIEYKGTDFCGWQKQSGKKTVQGELEEALFNLTGEKVSVEGSGRTDKGVHAIAQVATVKLENKMPLKNMKYAINNLLPDSIFVKKVAEVAEDFHARFSTKKKTYKYVALVGGERSALENDTCGFYAYDVDFEKVKNAANLLIGRHNFKGFCSANTQVTNFEREIYDIHISKNGRKIIFEICGNGFLYNMVRIVVGTLLDVGSGRLDENNISRALETGNRQLTGKTMPASGLYLKKVEYK